MEKTGFCYVGCGAGLEYPAKSGLFSGTFVKKKPKVKK